MVETLDVARRPSMLWLIPALPLAVAALNLFVGTRLGRWAGVLATLAVAVSFAIVGGRRGATC